MNLEQQVVSLEYAEKLKELGVGQQSLFYWFYTDAPLKDGSRWELKSAETLHDSDFELGDDWCSAFTVAELGEMIPFELRLAYRTVPEIDGWRAEIWNNRGEVAAEYVGLNFISDKNEANCRAKLLIYLIENNLYDPKTQKT